jgi:hypothetical protein
MLHHHSSSSSPSSKSEKEEKRERESLESSLRLSMEGMPLVWRVYYVENGQLTKIGHVCRKPGKKCCYFEKIFYEHILSRFFKTSIFFPKIV